MAKKNQLEIPECQCQLEVVTTDNKILYVDVKNIFLGHPFYGSMILFKMDDGNFDITSKFGGSFVYIRSHYGDTTFIQPTEENRQEMIRLLVPFINQAIKDDPEVVIVESYKI